MVALQVRPLLMLVDESGRLRAPSPGASDEVGVLAAVLVPAYRQDLAQLNDIVRELKRRVLGNSDSPDVVKARMCEDADLRFLATSIRHQYDWLLVTTGATYSANDAAEFAATIRDLGKGLSAADEGKPGAVNPDGLDPSLVAQTLREVELAYEALAERDPVFAALLFRLLVEITEHTRRSGLLPLIDARMDHRPIEEGAVNTLARFTVFTQYREFYARRLGEMLGLRPTAGFSARFTTDHVQSGLILADILAGARSRVLRGDDPDGRWARFLDGLHPKPGERSLLPPIFRVPGRVVPDVPLLG
jgi:hypothetical protein